ncbi:MAG: hypothetical protein FD153_560, partial [Rhodospirillaceae bacterium]
MTSLAAIDAYRTMRLLSHVLDLV